MTVEIRLSGAAGPALAEPAEDLLRAAANVEPERRNLGHDEAASKGEGVAVAALIISIPAATVATMELVDRAGIAERVRRILKKVRGVDGTATLHVGEEPSIDLRSATEDEVMDLLAKTGHS